MTNAMINAIFTGGVNHGVIYIKGRACEKKSVKTNLLW